MDIEKKALKFDEDDDEDDVFAQMEKVNLASKRNEQPKLEVKTQPKLEVKTQPKPLEHQPKPL